MNPELMSDLEDAHKKGYKIEKMEETYSSMSNLTKEQITEYFSEMMKTQEEDWGLRDES
jgi:hypothetical protein